jgi:hypothetical protein
MPAWYPAIWIGFGPVLTARDGVCDGLRVDLGRHIDASI